MKEVRLLPLFFKRSAAGLGAILLGSALIPARGADSLPSFSLPAGCQQLVLALAPAWDSSEAVLQRWERQGDTWSKVGTSWPTRLGKKGLVWGRGLHGPVNGPSKAEGDGRAPAGAFLIEDAYGTEPSVKTGSGLVYHRIGENDLWVEDVTSPYYNQHLTLKQPPRTEWEQKQQMRMNDPAHKLKIFIGHNALPDIKPGAGSSIFFHIWRDDGAKPSAGCTVMAESNLRDLIAWLQPAKHPIYVLLPQSVYGQAKSAWGLP